MQLNPSQSLPRPLAVTHLHPAFDMRPEPLESGLVNRLSGYTDRIHLGLTGRVERMLRPAKGVCFFKGTAESPDHREKNRQYSDGHDHFDTQRTGLSASFSTFHNITWII
jgi:hypothetical protein